MKKIFTLLALAICSLTAMATDYTGTLNATMGGQQVYSDEATLSVDEATYTISTAPFSVMNGVANIDAITLDGLTGNTGADGSVTITQTSPKLNVTVGSMIGGQPLVATTITLNSATISNGTLSAEYTISLETFGDVNVTFTGTDTTTGINSVTTTTGKTLVEMYNLNGQQVDLNTTTKGVYIVKYADGTTAKVVKN